MRRARRFSLKKDAEEFFEGGDDAGAEAGLDVFLHRVFFFRCLLFWVLRLFFWRALIVFCCVRFYVEAWLDDDGGVERFGGVCDEVVDGGRDGEGRVCLVGEVLRNAEGVLVCLPLFSCFE